MSPTISLKIIVVGGGIAGLSAAIALRRAGHTVKVLERSSLSSEVGAAITIPPNATRILRAWGLDFTAARMVRYRAMQVVRADVNPMKVLHEYDQMAVEDRSGAPYVLSHRVDLHDALRSLAVGDGDDIPVEVVTKTPVVSYEAHAGVVTLADGETLAADMLVAADGVHSRAHQYVLGYEKPAVPSETTVIRFMIPTETVRGDPMTAQVLARGDGQVSIYTAADIQRWLVRYPCRNNELQNFGAYSSNDNEDTAVEDWNTQSNRDSLLRRLQGFHPSILEVCRKTTEILPLWKCADREPLERLHEGRLVLVGDAAHPMLPHLGQGATQAIEDAAVLGILCGGLNDRSEVQGRLELFERARKERVGAIQILSTIPVGVDSTEGAEEKFRDFFPEGQMPRNKREVQKFAFTFDCMKGAEELLRKHEG